MVPAQKRLLVPIEELRDAGDTKMADLLQRPIKKSIAAIDAGLKRIGAKIVECPRKTVASTTSIPGHIGSGHRLCYSGKPGHPSQGFNVAV